MVAESRATQESTTAHEVLLQESEALAAAIGELETANTSLRNELDAVRNADAQDLARMRADLAETQKICEEKLRDYENDLKSLLASWQQQQNQLNAWVRTISSQEQELQSTQAQLAESRTAVIRAELAHKSEKESWERDAKVLRSQLVQQDGLNLSRRMDESADAAVQREKFNKQSTLIEDLIKEINSTKEVF